MSFELFGIEFDGNKDYGSIGKKKMDKVCQIAGTKLIKEWITYGKKTGKVKSDEVNDLYKWIKMLEEDFDEFFDLKKDIDKMSKKESLLDSK
jgi:NADH:ubiquinone oxidoreductase subunit C